MLSWTKVRVAGPLAPYAPGFGRELRGWGYTDLSTAEQLRLMSHLSRWMAREGLDALGGEQIAAYCAARKADGYVARLTPGSLGRLLAFLQAQGVMLAAPAARPAAGAEEELLGRYRAYLAEERGLVPAVVSQYLKAAALFVDDYPGAVTGQRALDAAAVSAFCARELPRRGRASAADLASALRSFLRFLHVEGLVGTPVAQAVPAVANRKGCGLPRALPPATVAGLLASCDRRTRLGRRDYAMLMLLARLGLRAGEVASMSLDDIAWRAGELTVHGSRRRGSPGRCITPVTGPGSPGLARTGSGTAWLPRCWRPGPRSPRSARSCGMPGWRRPRSTRKLTIVRWMHWSFPGQEASHERAATPGRAG